MLIGGSESIKQTADFLFFMFAIQYTIQTIDVVPSFFANCRRFSFESEATKCSCCVKATDTDKKTVQVTEATVLTEEPAAGPPSQLSLTSARAESPSIMTDQTPKKLKSPIQLPAISVTPSTTEGQVVLDDSVLIPSS